MVIWFWIAGGIKHPIHQKTLNKLLIIIEIGKNSDYLGVFGVNEKSKSLPEERNFILHW